jgi:hypothetical protein
MNTNIISANCYRSGEIIFLSEGDEVPEGVALIASGPADEVRAAVEVMARHSRYDETLLVPGLPEADDNEQALTALRLFIGEVEKRLELQL